MTKALGLCALTLYVASATAFSAERPPESVPGEVLVKLKTGQRSRFSLGDYSGVRIKKELPLLAGNFLLLEGPQRDVNGLLAQLGRDQAVEYAEPNYVWSNRSALESDRLDSRAVMGTPDERFGLQWGLKNEGDNEPKEDGTLSGETGTPSADVRAYAAWNLTKGSERVVVAVIDSGMETTHPDLAANLWVNSREVPGNGKDDDNNGYVDDVHGYDFRDNDGDPQDGTGHGTHCAGTIGAAHGNGGVAGVMPRVSLMALRFISSSGNGDTADAVEAINYATTMGAHVLNNSWGGGAYSRALEDAIRAAGERGITFVAAAGNQGRDVDRRPYYPASYRLNNVIAVAAHGHTGVLAATSNYGKDRVHVAAPGRRVISTHKNGGYKVISGTSMAAPYVSGVLGLLLAKEGTLSPAQLRERLMATSETSSNLRRTLRGSGRVDAANFLRNVRPPRPQEPAADAWRTLVLESPFETPHPYLPDSRIFRTIHVPGAKHLRLIVEKHELEKNLDFLNLRDARGTVVARVTGKGEQIVTDYVDGDTVTLEFWSDGLTEGWGLALREVQYVR